MAIQSNCDNLPKSVDEKPILSVCILTYNHSKFIREALEGVFLQQTSFYFDVYIADDCSTDDTRSIIKEFKEKYPNQIHLVFQKENVGVMQNLTYLLSSPKSKYIAFFEGDDKWTDPLKLQIQVDFLENNSDFSLCFHKVEIINELECYLANYPVPDSTILNFKDILFKHYIPTCSIVFVRKLLPKPLPKWFVDSKIGDIPMELLLADKGKVKYFTKQMGAYRKHDSSLTRNKEHIKAGRRTYLHVYTSLNKHFKYKYFHLFSIVILKKRLGFVKDLLGLNSSLK